MAERGTLPEEFKVTKLKEAFNSSENGEVNQDEFARVLKRLGIKVPQLDTLMIFDIIDQERKGVVDYMQFYHVVKENLKKYPAGSATELVINMAYAHGMSQRGRKLRLDHKKRLNEVKNPPPKASSVPPAEPVIPKEGEDRRKKRDGSSANSLSRSGIDPGARGRRRSHEPSSSSRVAAALGPRSRRLDLFGDRDAHGGEHFMNEITEENNYKSLDDLVSFDSPREERNSPRFTTSNKRPVAKHTDSQMTNGEYENLFDDNDDEIELDDPKPKKGRRDDAAERERGRQLREHFDKLDDTIRTLVIESQQSILEALQQTSQSRSLEMNLLKDIRSAVQRADGKGRRDDPSSALREDIQRLAGKMPSVDFNGLSSEIDRIRVDLRSIRDDTDPHTFSEMQRSLESVQQALSNVGDHVGFNLGTKLDHLEAKLSRILSLVAKDKMKNLDPQTEAELRDERKRLREAIKFIEAQVKKFKTQKSDYKNQIRLESEKIRKERKLLSKEKDLLRKESAAMEQQKVEVKEMRYQVQKAQRKLAKRKGSLMSTDMSILNDMTAQSAELEQMKMDKEKFGEQLNTLKLKLKEDRKKFQDALNELKKSKKRLENQNLDLQQELSVSREGKKESQLQVKKLSKQIMTLKVENEEIQARKAKASEKEANLSKQDRDELEKERNYLAKMKEKLHDLAQKLTDERDNNAVAQDLDKKAKNIATQMKLLEAERDSLFQEREQFEAEKRSFLDERAEKEQSLQEFESQMKATQKKIDGQAKIMKREYPKFQSRLAKLEAEESRTSKKATELEELQKKLKSEESKLKSETSELKTKAEKFRASAEEIDKKQKEINAMREEAQQMKDELTLTKTTLRVKQDAFESLTRDFERMTKGAKGAEATKSDESKLVERLIQDEQTRLRKEFAEEKDLLLKQIEELKKETQKKVPAKPDADELRKKAEQIIQEERTVLEQEKERIKYLAKELHAAMDDLEKQKIQFEEEKRNWIRVISELVDDEAVLKEIHKMFERDKADKGKERGFSAIPSPRVPSASSFSPEKKDKT